jgi:hypothetical protein
MKAAPQFVAAPEQERTTSAMSESVQLVDVCGGVVTAFGLHPANVPGHVDPSEQT